ncbi:MAG: dTMP kinase [Sphaerochaetaceae bacterium]
MSARGRFIVIEGIDGTGKTTVAKILAKKIGAHLTQEPSSSPLGRALHRGKYDHCTPSVRARLYEADRVRHMSRILDILDTGRDVVCDRFTLSTAVYQGTPYVELYRADLTVLLDLPVYIARARITSRPGPISPYEESRKLEIYRKRYLNLIDAVRGHTAIVPTDTLEPNEIVSCIINVLDEEAIE